MSQHLLPPTHPGQANYIWAVRTETADYIVRSPRSSAPRDEDFWQGALRVFDANVSDLNRIRPLNSWLTCHDGFRVPRVLDVKPCGRHWFAIMEALPGSPPDRFGALSPTALTEVGRTLARLHQQRGARFGPPPVLWDCKAGQPLDQFWPRLHAAAQYILRRYYAGDEEALAWFQQIQSLWSSLPPPPFSAPILLDLDPSQFLTQDGEISGLVDTELYAVGPPELELVELELLLDPPSAVHMAAGYTEIAPLPDLNAARPIFRYWLRLTSFQGPVDWNDWMGRPHVLDATRRQEERSSVSNNGGDK